MLKADPSVNDMKVIKAIGITSLVAGTLDLLAAIIQTLVAGGSPVKLLQYIASGIFGPQSFSGGAPFALMGLAFHYMIAMIWTAIFFILYRAIRMFSNNCVFGGLLWGVFIWAIMNLVVLPLSNVPTSPWDTPRALIALLVLISAMGMPISYLAYRFYRKEER